MWQTVTLLSWLQGQSLLCHNANRRFPRDATCNTTFKHKFTSLLNCCFISGQFWQEFFWENVFLSWAVSLKSGEMWCNHILERKRGAQSKQYGVRLLGRCLVSSLIKKKKKKKFGFCETFEKLTPEIIVFHFKIDSIMNIKQISPTKTTQLDQTFVLQPVESKIIIIKKTEPLQLSCFLINFSFLSEKQNPLSKQTRNRLKRWRVEGMSFCTSVCCGL